MTNEVERSSWTTRSVLLLVACLVLAAVLVGWVRMRPSQDERAFVGRWIARRVGHDIPYELEYRDNLRGHLGFERSPDYEFRWAVYGGRLYVEDEPDDSWWWIWRRIVGLRPAGDSFPIVSVTPDRLVLDQTGSHFELVRTSEVGP